MVKKKNLAPNAGDAKDQGSIPGLGRSPGGGNGNSLQDSCLGSSIDRGAWWAIKIEEPGGHKKLEMTEHTHAGGKLT